MKRVKIMLSSLLVVAIVAGALAFKAYKSPNVCVYTKIDPSAPAQTLCDLFLQGVNSQTVATQDASYFATTLPNVNCPLQTTCVSKDVIEEIE